MTKVSLFQYNNVLIYNILNTQIQFYDNGKKITILAAEYTVSPINCTYEPNCFPIESIDTLFLGCHPRLGSLWCSYNPTRTRREIDFLQSLVILSPCVF